VFEAATLIAGIVLVSSPALSFRYSLVAAGTQHLRSGIPDDRRVEPGDRTFRGIGSDLRHTGQRIHRLLIAVPISFGIALFLTEVAPLWLRRPVGTPSSCSLPSEHHLRMWGLFVFAPVLSEHVRRGCRRSSATSHDRRAVPRCALGIACYGRIILVTYHPFITAIMRDVFLTTPSSSRSQLRTGATQWEVVWNVVLPTRASCGGWHLPRLGRALGETMRDFVIGNTHRSACHCSRRATRLLDTRQRVYRGGRDLHTSALIALGWCCS